MTEENFEDEAGTGRLQWVERTLGEETARMTYDWTSTGRISAVTLSIGSTDVSRAEYVYYDGIHNTDKGTGGYLQRVTRKRYVPGASPTSWETVSESFYSYHVSGAGSSGRLKYVLEAEAMASELEQKTGADYDMAFRMNVIQHHEEGIAMIDGFLPRLRRPDVRAMAERMKADQQKDIQDLRAKMQN